MPPYSREVAEFWNVGHTTMATIQCIHFKDAVGSDLLIRLSKRRDT